LIFTVSGTNGTNSSNGAVNGLLSVQTNGTTLSGLIYAQ
jgi:hypothetical protein